jgi:HSP20 family protein
MMTALMRWNPWREMAFLPNPMSRLFDMEEGDLKAWSPAVDVYEKDDRMVIKAELPGIEKKDVSLDFQDGVLTLKGERKLESEVREENYCRREITSGSFIRSFVVAADTDPDKITAEFNNGLLTITVPKPELRQPKQITVN